MQKLLKDAQKLTGVKYDINNLADVYNAIHAIQVEQKVAGTTANEAEKTISGSFNMLKASWQNLLTGFGTGQNLKGLMDNLFSSLKIVGQNLMPVVENVINSLAEFAETAITEFMPPLLDKIPVFINEHFPKLIELLISLLPQIIDTGIKVILSLIEGLVNALPKLIDMLPTIITSIVKTLVDNLPQILATGIRILGELATGIIKAIPELLSKLPEIYTQFVNKMKEFDWLQIGKDVIRGICEGLTSMGNFIWEAIKKVGNSMIDGIKNFFGIASPSKLMRDEIGIYLAEGIGVGFTDKLRNVVGNMQNALHEQIGNLSTNVGLTGNLSGIDSKIGNVGGNTSNVVNLTINTQHLDDNELDNIFNYMNNRFGVAF